MILIFLIFIIASGALFLFICLTRGLHHWMKFRLTTLLLLFVFKKLKMPIDMFVFEVPSMQALQLYLQTKLYLQLVVLAQGGV